MHDYSFIRGCFLVGCYYCFQILYAILCLKGTLGFDWVFVFWRLESLDFLYFAVFVLYFIRLRWWWNCAFWNDYNMHWAPIDLFCDTLFVYKTIEFSAVALNWLATSAFKKLYAILCLKKTLGFDWVFVFWRPKNFVFIYFAVSVVRFNRLRLWWNCAFWIDDNLHWALTDLFLWYSFCIHDYSFIRGCFLVACFYCFQKIIWNFVPQGNALLWLSLCFLETWKFRFSLLCCLCSVFNRLRWWCICAFWNDYNMHWALINLFYDTLFVYETMSFPRLLSTGLLLLLSKFKCNFVPQGNAWLWLSLCSFGDLKI